MTRRGKRIRKPTASEKAVASTGYTCVPINIHAWAKDMGIEYYTVSDAVKFLDFMGYEVRHKPFSGKKA